MDFESPGKESLVFLVQIWPQGFNCLQPELWCQILYMRDEGSSWPVSGRLWSAGCLLFQHTERWGEAVEQEWHDIKWNNWTALMYGEVEADTCVVSSGCVCVSFSCCWQWYQCEWNPGSESIQLASSKCAQHIPTVLRAADKEKCVSRVMSLCALHVGFCIALRIFMVIPRMLLGAGNLPSSALYIRLPVSLNNPYFFSVFISIRFLSPNNHNKSLPLLLVGWLAPGSLQPPPSPSALDLGESSPARSESHYRLQAQL